jgi:hypothetical protein
LSIVPQLPDDQHSVAGRDIRLGKGSVDVSAQRSGRRYRTEIDVRRVGADKITIGHTLPRGARLVDVRLDGRRVIAYDTRVTNRGLEVSVSTSGGHHELMITRR